MCPPSIITPHAMAHQEMHAPLLETGEEADEAYGAACELADEASIARATARVQGWEASDSARVEDVPLLLPALRLMLVVWPFRRETVLGCRPQAVVLLMHVVIALYRASTACVRVFTLVDGSNLSPAHKWASLMWSLPTVAVGAFYAPAAYLCLDHLFRRGDYVRVLASSFGDDNKGKLRAMAFTVVAYGAVDCALVVTYFSVTLTVMYDVPAAAYPVPPTAFAVEALVYVMWLPTLYCAVACVTTSAVALSETVAALRLLMRNRRTGGPAQTVEAFQRMADVFKVPRAAWTPLAMLIAMQVVLYVLGGIVFFYTSTAGELISTLSSSTTAGTVLTLCVLFSVLLSVTVAGSLILWYGSGVSSSWVQATKDVVRCRLYGDDLLARMSVVRYFEREPLGYTVFGVPFTRAVLLRSVATVVASLVPVAIRSFEE